MGVEQVLDRLAQLAKTLADEVRTSAGGLHGPVTGVVRPTFVTDSLSTAIHEAGHSITAWCGTYVSHAKRVSLKEKDVAGRVYYEQVSKQHSVDHLWSETVINLAGIAAQGLVLGKLGTIRASGDLERSREAVEQIAGLGHKVAVDIPWQPIPMDKSKIDLGRFYRTEPDPVVRGILNECYRKARYIIKRRRPLLDRVVLELMTKAVVEEHELTAIFGPRLVFSMRGMTRPIFILG